MGKKGGAARAAKMTPERRAEIAKNAAASRWKPGYPWRDWSPPLSSPYAARAFSPMSRSYDCRGGGARGYLYWRDGRRVHLAIADRSQPYQRLKS